MDILVGCDDFEHGDYGRLKGKIVYAGIGSLGKQVLAQIPAMACGDKSNINPLDNRPLLTMPASDLAPVVEQHTAIVHLIYAPHEISHEEVRTFLPAPTPTILHHHIQLTNAEDNDAQVLLDNESFTLVSQEEMLNILSQQQTGVIYFKEISTINAFMIKTYLRIMQPPDYRFTFDLPQKFRGKTNLLVCSFQVNINYSDLIKDAIDKLPVNVRSEATSPLLACFGGNDKTLMMDEFDEGCRQISISFDDGRDGLFGCYICNLQGDARWVVVSA